MAKAAKKATAKKSTTKKTVAKKSAPKKTTAKNKLGVENSLVNNINAHKESGTSKPKSAHTVTKKAYKKMEDNWGKDKK